MNAMTAVAAGLSLGAATPLSPQQAGRFGTVFALLGGGEWCSGGSVYIDLQTGSFMRYPRLNRRMCNDPNASNAVESGTLGAASLQPLRVAYDEALREGMRREKCDVIISNGGPEALVINGPTVSAASPEQPGCWSAAARRLHRLLFDSFGRQRPSPH